MNTRRAMPLAAALLFTCAIAAAQPATPSVEELWRIIQQQQAEIDALRAEIGETKQQVETTDDKVEATGEFVESLAVTAEEPAHTNIGGYGELHYTQLEADSGDVDEIDYHRFVLFVNHEFSDRVRFFSELELEHSLSGDGKPGEVELEQAFVQYQLTDNLYANTGLFLLPVGILNEIHEPPTFYGVERNDVESIIIPSTWWEAGAGMSGRFGEGFSWDVAVHSGLAMPTEGSSAFRVRSGRQKVAEAIASDLAYTARLKYTGIAGLELSASYQYQSDPSQLPGDGLDEGHLLTAHAAWQQGDFGLRALYAGWDFNGSAVEAAGADSQDGWFIEPSYRLTEKWGVYARYEDLDAARDQDRFSQTEFGFNYWPVPGVVLKMDYRNREHELAELGVLDFDAVDLGFGYSFQ